MDKTMLLENLSGFRDMKKFIIIKKFMNVIFMAA